VTHTPPATLRDLIGPVYVPAAIFGVGQGAALPIVALAAREHGASVAVSALVTALTGAGLLAGDLPAGRIVARFGERRSILGGAAAGAVGVLVCLVAWDVWTLAFGVLLSGTAMSVWSLARQRYLTEAVPLHLRARAMSIFATAWRTGALVGPFVGALAITAVGLRGGFAVQLVAVVVSGLLMARLPDSAGRSHSDPSGPVTPLAVASAYRHMFLTLGVGTVMLGAARASRDAVVPLWGDHIGLAPAQISLLFGAAGLLEVVVSTPAGHLMDRYGRRAVATPSLALLAVAYLLLPLTHSVLALALVTAVLGMGNGFGNGVVMTIGADVSPSTNRAEFLASWRLMHDAGMFGGPLAIGLVAASSLVGASLAIAGVAGLGAVVMWRSIPRFIPFPTRTRADERPTALEGSHP
jgi:MFS family permease